MSNAKILITLLISGLLLSGMTTLADIEGVPGFVNLFVTGSVTDMAIIDEEGYSQGSLFRTPSWLLAQIDSDIMSTVLDRGPIPTPTEVTPSYEGYFKEGYAALEAGNYRTAYTAFKKAIDLQPTSADAWYGLALALESQKRYLSALEAYTDAITYAKGEKTNWASYAGKGRVLYALNRFSEAQIALETAITQYELAGVSHPDELEEISRLLNEITGNSGYSENTGILTPSAYTPASITES
ncbi:tetratricopeptide repeat protein [Methanospirillum stamsii]|uniref:Uncharacterized protein n=1 Tax=Methanospirillum stamsii TaxID=1277351 RepID=A0A2V2NCT6_9EURY|nr:tetratricopeptide repeat protein [Methanospirillum stamsii]PWR73411.1 hypothetical protein DLD82_09150 [Methanospirillum stamsii]